MTDRIFAIVEGGVVVNTILAVDWPGAIDVTDLSQRPGPGWVYDGQTFTPPVDVSDLPTPEITHTPLMTHYAFLARLTLDEHVAIEDAMPTNTLLRVAKQRFDAAREVDVSLPETQQFVGLLAQMGLIAPERVPTLLAEMPLTERGAIHPDTHTVTP